MAVFEGIPGQGKSTFAMAVAAAITRGKKLPLMPTCNREHSGRVRRLRLDDLPTLTVTPTDMIKFESTNRQR
jgi:MoxR-like ATPase